jgi:hypothetical protein
MLPYLNDEQEKHAVSGGLLCCRLHPSLLAATSICKVTKKQCENPSSLGWSILIQSLNDITHYELIKSKSEGNQTSHTKGEIIGIDDGTRVWNVMANILHSCQVHQAAKTAVYLVGGSPYLKWHPVHDHKEHAHPVTALSSCMSLLCTILQPLLNYCSMIVV